MPTNHNINVNFRTKGSIGHSSLKTSAKGSIIRIKKEKSRVDTSFDLLKKHPTGSYGFNGISGKTVGLAVSGAVVGASNKALEIGMTIYSASSGEQITVGNIRKVKRYVFNPAKYFIDDIYNYGFLQQRIVNRQNESNDYYRELTGKAIVGEQYGVKR